MNWNASLLSDLELWYAMKSDIVRLGLPDFEGLPLTTIQHFTGFAMGLKEIEEAETRKAELKARRR